jgi:hypothetical protein
VLRGPRDYEAQSSDPPFTDRSYATLARDLAPEHLANLRYVDRDTSRYADAYGKNQTRKRLGYGR